MNKLVKLTDEHRQTGHDYILTTWRKGFRPPRLDGGNELCTPGFYHAYDNALLAVLHNPIHANFRSPRAYEIECSESDVCRLDGQMKVGFTACITLDEIELPIVTVEQIVRYAMGCACSVCHDVVFRYFADRWIDGADRASDATWMAKMAAREAAWAWAAREAARSAKEAASMAARATSMAAAESGTWAAGAADKAAWATRAARKGNLNLTRIAEWAMTDEPLSTLLEE